MKMDKEFLIKHRFWVGLIAFVPVWLLVVLMLLSDVGGKAEKQKNYEEAVKSVDFKNPKNESFLGPLSAGGHVPRPEGQGLGSPWKGQDGLMTWADDPGRAPSAS
jgi:hypothetical protein